MCDVIRPIWIFCPQMPPREIPKMSQIGVKASENVAIQKMNNLSDNFEIQKREKSGIKIT